MKFRWHKIIIMPVGTEFTFEFCFTTEDRLEKWEHWIEKS